MDNYNKRQDFVTVYDLPVLISRGFKYGISQEILWGTDNHGIDWQVHEEGVYYMFGKLDKDKNIVPSRTTMPRDEFEKLFGDIK